MISLKNNTKLNISVGRGRKETNWKNTQIEWSALVNKISKTHRTVETYAEYVRATKDEQGQIKDVGGFVGGHLKEGKRLSQNVLNRQIITLDVDFADKDFWPNLEVSFNNAIACYSTHKHSTSSPRLRLLIPLTKEVDADTYEAIARYVANTIAPMEAFDDTTFQASRLMYWPSTSSDGEYVFKYMDLPILDPTEFLASVPNWKDVSFWPQSSRVESIRIKNAKKQGDPLAKEGLIGAFCRTYGVKEVLDGPLSDLYEATKDQNRYTYAHGSTSGGLVVYEDKFAYSNHGTDPISGLLCNAFDLYRIHKFGDLDKDSKDNTPVNKLPSWCAMMEHVASDERVKCEMTEERLALAFEEFGSELLDVPKSPTDDKDKPLSGVDTEWTKKLTYNKGGALDVTTDNLVLILRNDPLIKDLGGHNLFNDRLEVKRTKLPWARHGEVWSDVDDSSLRHYIEKVYGILSSGRLSDAINMVFEDQAFHPVKDYLNGLKWDGEERLEHVLIDYLGAKDNVYVRTVTRKTLVAAVARIFNPGCKFDSMLTLFGPQGIGKSYLIYKLGKGWASDTLTAINGKESLEALDGVWLMEMGELACLKKSERESIKLFISKQEDCYRKAYAKRNTVNKRQCIFIGTTNETEFLTDPTGNRRFWVVDTDGEKAIKTVWNDLNDYEIDQIWAEAVHYYNAGENIMELSDEVLEMAIKQQATFTASNELVGIIEEFLEKKLSDNWSSRTVFERQQWINATEDFKVEHGGNVERLRVCVPEIWCECLGKNLADLDKLKSRMINEAMGQISGWSKASGSLLTYGPYGRQRGYVKNVSID